MPTTIHLIAYNLMSATKMTNVNSRRRRRQKENVCIGRGRMHLNMPNAHTSIRKMQLKKSRRWLFKTICEYAHTTH